MSQEILNRQLKAWHQKKCLRDLYQNWYEQINSQLGVGRTLEIGPGIGKFKAQHPNILTMDVEKTQWTDMVADAQHLPFKKDCLSNIVLFDVLHHIPNPVQFFGEALTVLKPCGRILIMEPYISFLSYFIYHYFHPEKVDSSVDPLGDKRISSNKPFDSNQSVATLIFFKKLDRFRKLFPQYTIIIKKRLAFLAYPLSGGFSGRQLLPDRLISCVSNSEPAFKLLAPFMAFRTLVVLEKHEK